MKLTAKSKENVVDIKLVQSQLKQLACLHCLYDTLGNILGNNTVQGKLYHRADLKPRYFCDIVQLDAQEEESEASYKNSLLASLRKEVL